MVSCAQKVGEALTSEMRWSISSSYAASGPSLAFTCRQRYGKRIFAASASDGHSSGSRWINSSSSGSAKEMIRFVERSLKMAPADL